MGSLVQDLVISDGKNVRVGLVAERVPRATVQNQFDR